MAVVAVTGAAGYVGANLVRGLLAAGQEVRALVRRDRRALAGLDLELLPGDLQDLEGLCRAFAGAELVYHAAGHISITGGEWDRLEAVNVHGTRNVLEACRRAGVRRLVHLSSVEALDSEPRGTPVDESRPLVAGARHSPYARSKAAGELAVRQAVAQGLDAVILNPTAIIGPVDYRQALPNQLLLALGRGQLWALIDGGFDWVDVRDVVDGALRAAAWAPAGARYLLAGHWASLRELADLTAEVTGVKAPRLVAPYWLARLGMPLAGALVPLDGLRALCTPTALEPLGGNRRVSRALVMRDLGYRPRPLPETVRDTLAWFGAAEGDGPVSSAEADCPPAGRGADGKEG